MSGSGNKGDTTAFSASEPLATLAITDGIPDRNAAGAGAGGHLPRRRRRHSPLTPTDYPGPRTAAAAIAREADLRLLANAKATSPPEKSAVITAKWAGTGLCPEPLDIRKFLDPEDGTIKWYPSSEHLPAHNIEIPEDVKAAFRETGVEHLARHHIISKANMLALWSYIYDSYIDAYLTRPEYAETTTLKKALINLIEISGITLNAQVREAVDLPLITMGASELLNGEEAEVVFNSLTNNMIRAKEIKPERAILLNKFQAFLVWSPWNIVIGPNEARHRSDGRKNATDKFLEAFLHIKLSDEVDDDTKALLALSVERFQAIEELAGHVQEIAKFLNKTTVQMDDSHLEPHSDIHDRILDMCQLIGVIHRTAKQEFEFNHRAASKNQQLTLKPELHAISTLAWEKDGAKYKKRTSELESNDETDPSLGPRAES